MGNWHRLYVNFPQNCQEELFLLGSFQKPQGHWRKGKEKETLYIVGVRIRSGEERGGGGL